MKEENSRAEFNIQALSDGLTQAVAKAAASIVSIHARRRIPSSGLVWSEGVVVSADHTIRRDEDITISLPDGSIVPASLAGRDPSTDLAALKVQAGGLVPAERSAAKLSVGHLVLAVGRARRLSASLGIVSSAGAEWRTWHGSRIDRYIQPDISIFDGFSGGPLIDIQGRVLGINTSGLGCHAPLTIPVETVERVVTQLLEKGKIARGYLGVGMQPVRIPDSMKQQLGDKAGRTGLLVVNVEPASPAERAGLLLGDVLVALGGNSVGDIRDVQAALGSENVGKEISASVIRGGVVREFRIAVSERPQEAS